MDKLAQTFRTAQLVSHNFHNLTKGMAFFADHEFFGELYPAYEAAYDSIVERDIGLGEDIDLCAINAGAGNACGKYDGSDMAADEMCAVLLGLERQIQSECAEFAKGASLGTNNLLADLADKSEMCVYKLRQRIK